MTIKVAFFCVLFFEACLLSQVYLTSLSVNKVTSASVPSVKAPVSKHLRSMSC